MLMMGTSPIHVSVLRDEAVAWLDPQPGGVFVDGTLGAGGHTSALAERVGLAGLVIGIDRDAAALDASQHRLSGLPVRLAQANFCDLPEVLGAMGIDSVDGVLLDLGMSSDQLADPSRGFSFDSDGPLDLRFDTSEGEPAWRLINRLSAEHLADFIYYYGEEKHSRRVARTIVERRQEGPIQTARQLAAIVRQCVPRSRNDRIDPATRTFQALRIAVNDELKSLEIALRRIPQCLRPQARLAIISFHSLEDRRVKEAFRDDPRYETLTRKPVRPSDEEIAVNPRARSAKLRVAARTAAP